MPFFCFVADESSAEKVNITRVWDLGVPATTPHITDFSGVAGFTSGQAEGVGHIDGEAKPGSVANPMLSFTQDAVKVTVLQTPSDPGTSSNLVSFNGALVTRLSPWEAAASLAAYKTAKGIA